MATLLKPLMLPVIFLLTQVPVRGQEIMVPAGTVIECTLKDPNLSSKTVAPGDPILCEAGGLRQFGTSVFPRGAYLQGRFVAARDPGHLWGKGSMELEFDHIISPSIELPISTKITSAPHLKVDLEGTIHGTGHARRDVIQWAIPVLWPEKVITLPMRGPRPVLKNEARITLKLMQDLTIPQEVTGREARPLAMPGAFRPSPPARDLMRPTSIAFTSRPDPALSGATLASSGAAPAASDGTLLILRDGSRQLVKDYWFDSGQKIQFLSLAGNTGNFPIEALDFHKTVKTNRDRGREFVMRSKDETAIQP